MTRRCRGSSTTSGYFASTQQISGSGFITPVEVSLWINVTVSNLPVASCAIDILRVDVFSPIDLQRLGVFSAALRDIEPFVGERAAHAAKHAAIDQVADRRFHHAPGRGSGKEHRLLRSEQRLQPRMNRAVKIFKIFAAMSDHRTRERRPRFLRYFNRTGNEKLVVRNHASKRPTPNVQRPMLKFAGELLDVERRDVRDCGMRSVEFG